MPIRVVSERSAAEIAERRAQEDALRALMKLAGNVLRVVRGAGKPYELGLLAHEFLEAERELYRLTRRALASHEIANALNVFLIDGDEPHLEDEEALEEHYAKHAAMRGALQIAASLFLGDQLRVDAGRRELMDGLRSWERRPKGNKGRRSPADDIQLAPLRGAPCSTSGKATSRAVRNKRGHEADKV